MRTLSQKDHFPSCVLKPLSRRGADGWLLSSRGLESKRGEGACLTLTLRPSLSSQTFLSVSLEECKNARHVGPVTYMKEIVSSFLINFSPQLPQRHLPGLQHLNASARELYSFDFPFMVFQQDFATAFSLRSAPCPQPSLAGPF